MGKKKRLHKERVARRNAMLNNPLTRGAVALVSRGRVIDELNRASTEDQIETLDRTVAGERPDKLRQAIMKKAPREMDKGIEKLLKHGEDVTVEALLSEIRSTPSFMRMCERVGVTLEWFEQLAKQRMEAYGL